jgi:hypothetical protein
MWPRRRRASCAAQRPIQHHDEERAAGVLQEAGRPRRSHGRHELGAREHEQQYGESEPLCTPPAEQQRPGNLSAGKRHDVRNIVLGRERLQTGDEDERAVEEPVGG